MNKEKMYSVLRDNVLATLKANVASPTFDGRLGISRTKKEMDEVADIITNALKTGNKADALASVMCMAKSFEEMLMYVWFAASAYTRYIEIINEKPKKHE